MYTCYHYREQIRILACLRTASFHRVSKQTETVKVDISDKVEYSQHYSCTEAKKQTKSSRLKCNKTHISFIYFHLGQRSRITVFQFSTPLAGHLAACKCSVNHRQKHPTPSTLTVTLGIYGHVWARGINHCLTLLAWQLGKTANGD